MNARPPLEIFETLRFDPRQGYVRLDLHLARLARSCRFFGVAVSLAQLAESLAAQAPAAAARVRISVSQGGCAPNIAFFPLPAPANAWYVAVHPTRLDAGVLWLRHKTNRRALYDRARRERPPGIDEWLFRNTQGQVCEGTITNVFLRVSGVLYTPPQRAGLLPGVLRQALIAAGEAREKHLSLAAFNDPANRLFVGNSLRGLVPATLVDKATAAHPTSAHVSEDRHVSRETPPPEGSHPIKGIIP